MNNLYFYQVQTSYLFIPEKLPVYMTLKQIQTRSSIVPDQAQTSDGGYFVTEHSTLSSLIFDQGEVFGLSQIPETALLAKLKPWQPPSPATLPLENTKNRLCRFSELAHQPDQAFKILTQLTRAEFAQQLAQLSLNRPRRGRQVRFEIHDALSLYCLHTQGQYTYAQLALCYQWSISQLYSAVQWVKKQFLVIPISSSL